MGGDGTIIIGNDSVARSGGGVSGSAGIKRLERAKG